MRKVLIVLAAGAIILSSCGSSKSSSNKAAATSASTGAPATVSSTTATTAASPTTTPPASTAGSTASTAGSATASTVDMTLVEWKIQVGPIKSGTVTFNAKNTGRFPHEVKVFKGSFADLPKKSDGSVNEAALPADALVGKIDRMEAGASGSATMTLAPGQYSLVCNLVSSGQSHAAKGQEVDVTVS